MCMLIVCVGEREGGFGFELLRCANCKPECQ